MESNQSTKPGIRKLIIALSIIIPVVVAVLFKVKIADTDLSFLPHIYAGINAVTAVLLVVALVAIKKKKIKAHETVIKICMVLSVLFLVCYVAYHMTSDSTKFGGEGIIKYIYYFILVTHIVLSIAIIPLVLITYVRALAQVFDKHKKIAKITYPIWLYVAVTGVVVYLMIAPYYAH